MIEKLKTDINLPYKLIDEDNGFKLIKLNSKLHILYLYEKGNRFAMERDFFDYLDGNSLPYAILCHDRKKQVFYYLRLNKKVNWVKSCFATCDKESLFLGKQVLNSQISENELKDEFLKYK